MTEYLAPDGSRRLADPQVHHGYDVPSTMDVPGDAFLRAVEAWRMWPGGRADRSRSGCGTSTGSGV